MTIDAEAMVMPDRNSAPPPVFGPVALYYALAVSISWSIWGVMIWQGRMVAPGTNASHLPGLMGPLMAAVIATAAYRGPKGLADLAGRCVRWPGKPLRVAGLILLPVVIAALWFALRAAAGDPLPPISGFLAYPGVPAAFSTPVALLVILILNGFGEEAGWRGFMFDTLLQRTHRFGATAIVAGAWLLWHLPLFWLNAAMAELIGPVVVGWAIGLILGAFAMSYLYLLSGRSILAVSVWHVGYNLCVATEATRGTLAAIVSTVVMIWGAAVCWAWFRSRNADRAQPGR